MIRRILGQTLLTAVLFAGIFCLTAHAQLNNGTIRGTVTDSNGAVLPNANVTLTRLGTDEHFATVSNKTGGYTFTALSPGDYEVEVSANGFATQKGKLTLRVAQEAVIDEKLKVGSTNASVTVQGDITPEIDTADATLSDVKNSNQIETLPVENNDIRNILNFSPGIVAADYGGQGDATGNTLGSFTRVDGIPGGSVTFMVDGQSANDRSTNDLQSNAMPTESVQEIKVTTSNGSAEYATPGVVDIVTKGGTNDFHGQAHELNRGAFEANGPNADPSSLVHNEFGGQIGGPVWIPKFYNGKNKTFFYFDVEAIREHYLAINRVIVPEQQWLGLGSDAAAAGGADFSDYHDRDDGAVVTVYDPTTTVYNAGTGNVTRTPFAGNVVPFAEFNSVAKAFVPNYPLPNNPVCLTENCFVDHVANWLDPNSEDKHNTLDYTAKLDQVFGSGLLSARYTYTSRNVTEPPFGGHSSTAFTLAALGSSEIQTAGGHNGALSYTRPIGTHAVNEFRVGVQIYAMVEGPQPFNVAQFGIPTYSSSIAWPGIYVDDNWDYKIGYFASENPKSQPNQNITAGDNYSWTIGKHEVKIGATATNYRVTTTEDQNPGGNMNFSGNYTGLQDPTFPVASGAAYATTDTGVGLADMMLGLQDYEYAGSVPVFHTRQTDLAGYVQDNWKISPRLTLNLGVRYEYWTSFKDAGGLTANLDFNTNTTGTCMIPGALTSSGNAVPCVAAGTAGYPSWFAQSQPTVVIPNSGSGQSPVAIAAYEALGLPVETASQAGEPNSLWNMPKNNWAPRVGFAYAINSKTSIHGGYGIYYWAMPLQQYQQNTRDNAPWNVGVFASPNNNNEGGSELSYPLTNATVAGNPASWAPYVFGTFKVDPNQGASINQGFGLAVWDTNYKAQNAQEYNLSIERILPYDWTVSLSYVGNHGSNLVNYDPINANLPQELVTGVTNTSGSESAYHAYPLYGSGGTGSMDIFRFDGYSNHNELRAEVKHVFKGSFVVDSFATWSKSLTTSEGNYASFGGLEMLPAALTNNASLGTRLGAIYAPDSYLADKSIAVNVHYELPFGKGKKYLSGANTVVDSLVTGWTGSIFYLWHSGLYFSPYYSVTGSHYNFAPGAIHPRGVLPEHARSIKEWYDGSCYDITSGNDCSNPGVPTPYAGQTYNYDENPLHAQFLNNIPRNYMTGPGFQNADGTLQKITPVTKYAKLDLEMQVFNVFNHPNYEQPGEAVGLSGGIGTPRLLQFQGKIIF